ncbi:MAG: hypothetical protein IJD79_10580 [Clostridia bacterium]|nr:hypothetical protein [Clostridia bacterium]
MNFENKKKYTLPNLELVELDESDVIRTSPGVDAPIEDDPFGEWEV